MRIIANLILSSLVLFLVSCNDGGNEKKEGAINETTKKEVKMEVEQAKNTISEYLYERKDDLIAEGRKNLDEIGRDIEQLENRLENDSEKMKEKIVEQQEKTLAQLREQRNDLRTQLDSLENSSEDAWKDMSKSFQEASRDLKEGLKNAREELDNSKNNNSK